MPLGTCTRTAVPLPMAACGHEVVLDRVAGDTVVEGPSIASCKVALVPARSCSLQPAKQQRSTNGLARSRLAIEPKALAVLDGVHISTPVSQSTHEGWTSERARRESEHAHQQGREPRWAFEVGSAIGGLLETP